MPRVLALIAAVLLAAVAAFLVFTGGRTDQDRAAVVERLLAEGRAEDAREELEAARAHVEPATADYLDGLVLLAEGKDADAAPALARAHAARPSDWRIVSALAAAYANSERADQALALVDAYVAASPQDERGLAMAARLRLDEKRGTSAPAEALALLDRIDALPERVAPAGDRTAVPAALLASLRAKALLLDRKGMEALQAARDAAERSPKDAEAWFLLGEAARRMGKGPEAVDAFRRAARLEPGTRRYPEQLALALIAFEGDAKELLELADSLLARWPGDPALRLLRARALVRQEDPHRTDDDPVMEEAASIYRDLLREEATPAQVRQDARRNLAVLLYDWKVAGKSGPFLDEAWGLLKTYRAQGGVIDASLRATWEDLEARARKKEGGG